MIKTDIQDLTDITDVKNARLSDKNGIEICHTFCQNKRHRKKCLNF